MNRLLLLSSLISLLIIHFKVYSSHYSNNYYFMIREFSIDALAFSLALFGLCYRYGIRRDNNPNLKQGLVGTFILTRALVSIHVPTSCSSIPLDCGPPFHLFTYDMFTTGFEAAIESTLAYGGAALFLEYLFRLELLSKFPRESTTS